MQRELHTIDAANKAIGRIATEVATLLRGKNKADFQPHIDGGDKVQVNNIAKAKFSGKKMEQKEYYRYSGYPGGLKTKKIADIWEKNPAEVLQRAVREMLPPVKFRKEMMKRLTIK